ncbi:MAG: hypothetical protein GY710_13185 [Desulfobacteraceae bacterium]|nr:hypothetical protein [Desulfobacteraceae bacterium]
MDKDVGNHGKEFVFFKRCIGNVILIKKCGTLSANTKNEYNLKDKNSPVSNDDVVGFKAYNIAAGTVIRMYDDSQGSTQDDWCEIIFKKDCKRVRITDLEQQVDNDKIRMLYFRDDNLNGKVSRIEINPGAYTSPDDYPGYLAFYSKNDCEGGLSGCVNSSAATYNCTKDDSPIKNDDARSLVLYAVQADINIVVYDNSSESTSDDYCTISVLEDVPANEPCGIPTFEKNQTYEDIVKTDYEENNGLDGKVSSISIS